MMKYVVEVLFLTVSIWPSFKVSLSYSVILVSFIYGIVFSNILNLLLFLYFQFSFSYFVLILFNISI